jgi:hypothetical protein
LYAFFFFFFALLSVGWLVGCGKGKPITNGGEGLFCSFFFRSVLIGKHLRFTGQCNKAG